MNHIDQNELFTECEHDFGIQYIMRDTAIMDLFCRQTWQRKTDLRYVNILFKSSHWRACSKFGTQPKLKQC